MGNAGDQSSDEGSARTSMAGFDLEQASSYSGAQLSCDLIMKGGVTSGVVYPRAACRLATRYRFKQVGGASAGAIAAALTAAAEYHRQSRLDQEPDSTATPGGDSGFVRLHGIPAELGSNLGDLFQPVKETRPAYSVLMAAAAPGRSKPAAVAVALYHLATQAPLVFLAVLIGCFMPLVLTAWGGQGRVVAWMLLVAFLLWLVIALVVALLAATAWVGWRTYRAVSDNGFGLCNGHLSDGRVKHPPLTDWMATTLDGVAGLEGGPLTFGHLWGAEASETYRRLKARQAAGGRVTTKDWGAFRPNIDLKVMTTNLTLRKPYAFPFSTDDFYYCAACLSGYFPESTMLHLQRHSKAAPKEVKISSRSGDQMVRMRCPRHPGEDGQPIRELPDAPSLPVVIAARLSLSFPGLISAVPLLCIDYSRAPKKRQLVLNWFSDGGIASNFPMHFFDAPWPRRPTFGINLEKEHPDYQGEMVWRPLRTLSGVFPRSREPKSVVDFVVAIVRTMQNWVDNSQITMPGYRDRVTELRTRADEGGLNLRMEEGTIRALADRGSDAALQFELFDLSLHQWTRYRTVMSVLSDTLDVMHARWYDADGDEGYRELIRRFAGMPGDYQLAAQDAEADAKATALLMDVAEQWAAAGYPAMAPRVPEPKPVFRQMPPM
jgi:predicted acylesterase/phospholipase RssA